VLVNPFHKGSDWANAKRGESSIDTSSDASAFVFAAPARYKQQRRCIQDNILLCHDMLKKFHLPQGKARMCVQIYLRKAFDSVDWGFREAAMLAM